MRKAKMNSEIFYSRLGSAKGAKWVTRKANNTKTTRGKKGGGNSKFVKSLRKALQKKCFAEKRKESESNNRGYTINLDFDFALYFCFTEKPMFP